MRILKDKVAVITGAGSGIGRAIALALADAGTHVVVSDIQEAPARKVAEEVRSRGVRALAVVCDVAKHESVVELADRAYAEFGRVDILCNNAGISWRPFRNIWDATMADWHRIFGVNLFGVIHGLDVFIPRMRKQPGEKHIVNTASLAALQPMEGHAPYSSSKAAVAGLSESIAMDLEPEGFGVTILCPGHVETNLTANTLHIQGGDHSDGARRFDPVELKTMKRFGAFGLDSAEPVGVMVRNAILNNQLYLHTVALPSELVAERVYKLYGSQAVGKA